MKSKTVKRLTLLVLIVLSILNLFVKIDQKIQAGVLVAVIVINLWEAKFSVPERKSKELKEEK